MRGEKIKPRMLRRIAATESHVWLERYNRLTALPLGESTRSHCERGEGSGEHA
jgi:hypothetical protein